MNIDSGALLFAIGCLLFGSASLLLSSVGMMHPFQGRRRE